MTTATLRADLKTLRAEQPVALAPRTLIIGKNGSGKSAITQAIEYALTGSVTDMMGRALVKQQALLNTLAPPERNLHASLEMPAGSGSHINGQPGVNPELVFPLRAIRDNLLGAPERGRQWLLTRMGVDADGVVAELAAAKAHAKQAAADVAMLQERIATLGQNAQPVTEADRAALAQTTGFSPEELAAMVEELRRLHAQASTALAAFQALPTPPATDLTLVRGAHSLVRSFAAAAAEAERYAALAGGHAPSNIDQTPISGAAWAQMRAFWQNAEQQYAPMLEQTLARETAQAQAQALINEYQTKLAAYKEAAKHPKPDVSALKARIEAWDTLGALRQQYTQRADAGTLAAAKAQALQARLAELLHNAAERFNDSVTAHLGIPGARFELVLTTSGAGDEPKATLRWGLRREDGRLDVALSGAEWMRAQLAMACALVPTDWAGPVFLLAEDRAWDPAALADAMRALTAAPANYWIVLTSTAAPQEPVSGWAIIGADGRAREVTVPHVGLDARAPVRVLAAETPNPLPSLELPPPPPAFDGGESFVELPAVPWQEDVQEDVQERVQDGADGQEPQAADAAPPPLADAPPPPKKRGRPKGSKNKPKNTTAATAADTEAAPDVDDAEVSEPAPATLPPPPPVPVPAPAPSSTATPAADPRLALLEAAVNTLLAAVTAPAGAEPPTLPPLPPALDLPEGLQPFRPS